MEEGYERSGQANLVGKGSVLLLTFFLAACSTTHQNVHPSPFAPTTPDGEPTPTFIVKLPQTTPNRTPRNERFLMTAQVANDPWQTTNPSSDLKVIEMDPLVQNILRVPGYTGNRAEDIRQDEALAAALAIHAPASQRAHTAAKQPTQQKTLKDLVGPNLQKRIEQRKERTITTKSPHDIRKLHKQVETFKRAERIFGVPAIFFATTLCRESTWGKDDPDNPLQYLDPSFADQLREVGPAMLKRLSDNGKTPRTGQDGQPVISERAFEDTRYAVRLMVKENGRPQTKAQARAVRTAKHHELSELGLISVYLEQHVTEISDRLFHGNKELAQRAHNGLLYVMYNFGANAIDEMSKHPNAPVNRKYADAKKCALFGLNRKTDTNYSAIMKAIADYEGYEAGVKVLLAQHGLLPAQPVYGGVKPAQSPVLLAAKTVPGGYFMAHL